MDKKLKFDRLIKKKKKKKKTLKTPFATVELSSAVHEMVPCFRFVDVII